MDKLREKFKRDGGLQAENEKFKCQVEELISAKTELEQKVVESDAKFDAVDVILADIFYDVWFDIWLSRLPRYPKIVLSLHNSFIGGRRRKAIERGKDFNEDAIFLSEFNKKIVWNHQKLLGKRVGQGQI